MSLPEKNRRLFALETDLPVGLGDFQTTPSLDPEENSDLAGYLAFLEAIGAFKTKKTEVKIYPEEFQLR
jgi:hypothetical protein